MTKVSVIVPSYNHKRFVTETILSVINQTYPEIELIVIDDGSTDGSTDLLQALATKHHFKLILKSNEGICATFNRGLEEATGELITFIASDDFMPESRIAEQVEFFRNLPDVDIIAGAMKVINEESVIISTKKVRTLGLVNLSQMLKKNMVYAPTAMFRKEVFSKFGKYRNDYPFEDYYMWLKVLSSGGSIYNTDKIWAYYRINRSNLERRFAWYYQGYLKILSDYLPDPRAQAAINHYHLIHSAKMTFLNGTKFIQDNQAIINKLPFIQRIAIWGVALIPSPLRKKMLFYLLKEM